jgi:predicted ester cyclase
MSTHPLVESFYARMWNTGDEHVDDLLAADFTFGGSLGTEADGLQEFLQYARSVRRSLASYHCGISECVTEPPRAFAQMLFSGVHMAAFRGSSPTGKPVQWHGAALFTFRNDLISDLWVLRDLVGLDHALSTNAGL